MSNSKKINNKINSFNKTITVSGDKSLSIRWVLFSSLAKGKSKAFNLLLSEDVLAAINAIKKFGIKRKRVSSRFYLSMDMRLGSKHCLRLGQQITYLY